MKKENTALRLKQIMQERNLRQVDILELTVPYCKKYDAKMNKSDISQYVSGKVEPSQDKLVILGMALNVSEAWLMGYDVTRDSNLTFDEMWDIDAEIFSNEMYKRQKQENAFMHQLKIFGWTYETKDNGLQPDSNDYDVFYIFYKKGNSFRVSYDDFTAFLSDTETFFNVRLEKLYEKSRTILFPTTKSYLEPQAAHHRTDIAEADITDDMKQHDDDIMDDPNF